MSLSRRQSNLSRLTASGLKDIETSVSYLTIHEKEPSIFSANEQISPISNKHLIAHKEPQNQFTGRSEIKLDTKHPLPDAVKHLNQCLFDPASLRPNYPFDVTKLPKLSLLKNPCSPNTHVVVDEPQPSCSKPRPRTPEANHTLERINSSNSKHKRREMDIGNYSRRVRSADHVPSCKRFRAGGVTSPMDAMKTPEGCVEPTQQLSLQRKVTRSPDGEIVHRTISSKKVLPTGRLRDITIDIEQHVDFAGLPDEVTVADVISRGKGYTEVKRVVEHKTMDEQGSGSNLKAVMQMVKEESDDVDRTLMLEPVNLEDSLAPVNFLTMKTIHKMRLNTATISDLEQSLPAMQVSADEEQEEIPPEILAAMMDAQEKGLNLESPPARVYNFLAGIAEDNFVEVSPVAPGPLSEVIVPAGTSESFAQQLTTPDMEDALHAINDLPSPTNKDGENNEAEDDDIYTRNRGKEKFDKSRQHVQNVALVFNPKHPTSTIENESAPWDEEDVAEVSRISGAGPSSFLTRAPELENLDISSLPVINELADSFEYITLSGPPQHYSRVQLRGGSRPQWFPGYFISLPGMTELVKTTANPNRVLPAAWKAVQPVLYEEEGSLVL